MSKKNKKCSVPRAAETTQVENLAVNDEQHKILLKYKDWLQSRFNVIIRCPRTKPLHSDIIIASIEGLTSKINEVKVFLAKKMGASKELTITCETKDGCSEMKYLSSEPTASELKTRLDGRMTMRECMKIIYSCSPKTLTDKVNDLKLKDLSIESGETIIAEKKSAAIRSNVVYSTKSTANNSSKSNVSSSTKSNAASSAKSDAAASVKPDAASSVKSVTAASAKSDTSSSTSSEIVSEVAKPENPPAVENPVDASNIGELDEEFLNGVMMRHVVPSNNSCLFTSIYFVLSNGDLNAEKSAELRKLIARAVSSNPEKFSTAYLGMTNREYCTWIQNTDHWGGAIELAILSEHFRIEIVAVDIKSLGVLRFGENCDCTKRIFLIYDGIHYDPLILELENAPMQTIFPVSDDRPMEMALEIAREAKSSKQYTDIKNFSLHCSICKMKMQGDKEAREHALRYGHVGFGEITD